MMVWNEYVTDYALLDETLGTVASVAASTLTGGSVEFEITVGRLYRFLVSGLSGSGTIVAKIYC